MAHEAVVLAVHEAVARVLDLPAGSHRAFADAADEAVWVEEPVADLGGVLVQLDRVLAALAAGPVQAVEVPPAEELTVGLVRRGRGGVRGSVAGLGEEVRAL